MKLMTLDGNSLAYRAFYALPEDMSNASGQSTNAVYGFVTMLINLVKEHRPDVLLVAFDRPEPTFRHQAMPEYKAQREKAPDALFQQLGIIREVLDALGVRWLEMAGFEGDDVIATVTTRAAHEGHEVIVVTGDKDSYQLVRDPSIRVLYNKRGVSDYALYDEAGIVERTGVTAAQYPDFAALRGDPSDNLDGVPGVGEKTAAKLIQQYGDIASVFANADSQTPKLKANLIDHAERVTRNAAMMRLRTDVPIDIQVGDCVPAVDIESARRLFDFLEFKTMMKRVQEVWSAQGWGDGGVSGRDDQGIGSSSVLESISVVALGDADSVTALITESKLTVLAPRWIESDAGSAIDAIAIVMDAEAGAVGWFHADLLADPGVCRALAGARGIVAHDAKPLMRALLSKGIDITGLVFDTSIAAYLINPSRSGYSLIDVSLEHLGVAPEGGQVDSDQFDFGSTPDTDAMTHTGREALHIAALMPVLSSRLEELGATELFENIEIPLVRVLARMEHHGIGVDIDVLTRIRERLTKESASLTDELYAIAGRSFNVNSPAQLREILFTEHGLTPGKKTKTGYSTDHATLEKLHDDWPEFIGPLLRFREIDKLRSTFAEGLLNEVAADGRIHATFHQAVARTGRLSSDRPNLHNIPVRTEEGRVFRTAFVAAEGSRLLVADYNQIELRCIAHLADDPGLVAAFEAGQDIHEATAARVFSVDPASVTHDQRSKAKMVSYGLAYGMEAYGLSQRLAIPVDEAAAILNAYFEAFPAVKHYMDEAVSRARQLGYTETLFGRRRPIEELRSDNFRVRQAGERQAMNAAIQGLAADIFKIALVRIDGLLEQQGLQSRIVLQVHDEVIVEVPGSEAEAVGPLVLDTMKGAASLRVPLEVNAAWGRSWADAKA